MKIVELTEVGKIIISSDIFSAWPKTLTESLSTSGEENITILIDSVERYHELSEFLEDKKFIIIDGVVEYLIDGLTATKQEIV